MLKCASFFAGIGGIDLGFEKAGFKTIFANEFDKKSKRDVYSKFSGNGIKCK